MKKLKAAIVGVGNRGGVYGDYCNLEPNELEIIALIDPNTYRLKVNGEKFHVPNENLFTSIEEFLLANIRCDFVINSTMDEIHLSTSLPLLKHGYNLMLEKPMVENVKKLKLLIKTAKKYNCQICVCHVLRYTPFYSTIKNIIDSGKIGEIVSMELHEHVWKAHMVNSYVRGKWRNEKLCGSSFLLAKCCHDTDLMCWFNNVTSPKKVSSFGQRKMFCPEKAPKEATQYCYQCPIKEKCLYNAEEMEAKKDFFPKYTWKNINKSFKDISLEERLEYLKTDIMGQCVYKTDMDIVDRQSVSVEFENGSIGTLMLVGGSEAISRHVHIVGSEGEILGYLGENRIILRTMDFKEIAPKEEIIDLNIEHKDGDEKIDSHFGGDYGIMKNICAYFRGDKVSNSLTKIEDSINSHLVCYYAEKARKKNKVVKIKQF